MRHSVFMRISPAVRSYLDYAWTGSSRHAAKWWAPIPGGVIAWLIFLVAGWPMTLPDMLPKNPFVEQAVVLFICVLAAQLLAFVARLCYAPIYYRLERQGGLIGSLRARLEAQMWPIILMFSGLASFVVLFGAGAILFAMRPVEHPSSTSAPVVKKHLAYEVERQLRAIDDVRAILNGVIMRRGLDGVTLHRDVSQQLQSGTVKTSGIAKRLLDLAKIVEADLVTIQNIVETHADYPYFRAAIGYDPFNPFSVVSGARNLAADIDQLSADADSKYLLRGQSIAEFGSAVQGIGNWAMHSSQNLGASRQQVEALPIYEVGQK